MSINREFGFGKISSVAPIMNKLVEQSNAWGIKTIFVSGSSAQPFAYLFKQIWIAKYSKPLPHFLALGQSPINHPKWKKRLLLFAQKNPELKKMPSLVFDEFAYSGASMRHVRDTVRKAGFVKLKTAILGASPHVRGRADFVGVKSRIGAYKSAQEKRVAEYLEIFAGQRRDILQMAKERRNPKTMYAHGEAFNKGKIFLKDLRANSRATAKRYARKN